MSELTYILDDILPLCNPLPRRRSTDPWFDIECRDSKRATRRLERAYLASCRLARSNWSRQRVADVAASKAAWYAQRRVYRQLRQRKCLEFWQHAVDQERSNPR